ncbi:uncharacterized protein LOC143352224 [Halictus rubicundus]|uniref:uncharacterized protein LOC143352224 n=1 Tax=Halictus rubicundus TaxID=77578 RepID=UPI0040364132
MAAADNIVSIDTSVGVTKYCRDKERLITSEEIDEYLLINAEIDSIVTMECHFCNDKEEKQTKIWYHQDRYREMPEKVVELGMDNNMSFNRIYTTPDLSLVIKNFEATDAAIYLCHGEEGQEAENKFNYRIEPVFKDHTSAHTEKGNVTEWEKYREIYLATITTRFAVSQMSELVEIRDAGITLHVISEWAPWSPCENCIGNRGYKSSVGRCRLKRFINMTIANNSDSSIVKFFRKSPLLPCKSILLEREFPGVSTAVRYLPDFVLKEQCKKCVGGKKKKSRKYRYLKRYVLTEGAYLTVVCPESSLDTQVSWKKDSITLEKGVRRSFRKLDPTAHVVVDAFGTLYLIDATIDEGGNYTCAVDNVNMMQLIVVVVSNARLLTQEFLRHLGYLGFVFFLCSFCYCSGLIHTFRRRHQFRQRTSAKRAEKGGTGEDEEALLADQN